MGGKASDAIWCDVIRKCYICKVYVPVFPLENKFIEVMLDYFHRALREVMSLSSIDQASPDFDP